MSPWCGRPAALFTPSPCGRGRDDCAMRKRIGGVVSCRFPPPPNVFRCAQNICPLPRGEREVERRPMAKLRLGVNVDHVATVRQARGGDNPDPVRAAILAQSAGADGITAHLREDRRHISDDDIARLSKALSIPLNLEMAATDEMAEIALRHKPHAACIVPEKREERTTEGGIDAAGQHNRLASIVGTLVAARIRVSMFIEPDKAQLDASKLLGAPVVELHTGAYANATGTDRERLLAKIRDAAA